MLNKYHQKLPNSLLPDEVKTLAFNLLPKIHKLNNPGMLVTSSLDCHTSRISEFVVHYLQPTVTNLKKSRKSRLTSLKK